MPVGLTEAVAIWVLLAAVVVAAPLLALAFYWRTPRPKTLAVLVSTVVLYPIIWAGLWVLTSVAEGSGSVLLLFYLPVAGALLVAFIVLYPVRTLLQRFGCAPRAA